jgi:hypothetical protein
MILRRALLHRPYTWALLAIGVFGVVSAAFASYNAISLLTGGLIWLGIVGGYTALDVERVAHRRSKRVTESALTLSEEGVSLEDDTGRLTIPWARVTGLRRVGPFLMIRAGKGGFAVPDRAFPSEDELARFSAFATDRIAAAP